MLKGFKDFILRGNIVDLAVAVVIGTAFVALVTAFTESFINPVLAVSGGGSVGEGLGVQLGEEGNAATFIDIGGFITAIITFLITAAVVYFAIVVPMKKLQEMRARGQEPEPEAAPEDVLLLQEIRDLLAGRGTTPSDTTPGNGAPTTPTVPPTP
ncbi:MAG: large conductance mechanosensitive channel protein MscL [Actinomycetota bacterium]|nr:large conductance mechanosensitive channel protein MscL [Actinomycetota bacterium]